MTWWVLIYERTGLSDTQKWPLLRKSNKIKCNKSSCLSDPSQIVSCWEMMIALFARVGTSALKCAINIIRRSPWLQNVSPIVMMMAGAYHPLFERNSSRGPRILLVEIPLSFICSGRWTFLIDYWRSKVMHWCTQNQAMAQSILLEMDETKSLASSAPSGWWWLCSYHSSI